MMTMEKIVWGKRQGCSEHVLKPPEACKKTSMTMLPKQGQQLWLRTQEPHSGPLHLWSVQGHRPVQCATIDGCHGWFLHGVVPMGTTHQITTYWVFLVCNKWYINGACIKDPNWSSCSNFMVSHSWSALVELRMQFSRLLFSRLTVQVCLQIWAQWSILTIYSPIPCTPGVLTPFSSRLPLSPAWRWCTKSPMWTAQHVENEPIIRNCPSAYISYIYNENNNDIEHIRII